MANDKSNRHLAFVVVRPRHHRYLGDVRVPGEDVLHFLGVDLLPTDIDAIIAAPDKEEVAVGVATHQITSMEPPVPKFVRGGIRPFPIANRHPWISHQQFPHFAISNLGNPILANEPNVGSGHGSTATPWLAGHPVPVGERNGASFRETVPLDHRGPKDPLELGHQLRRGRG